MKNLKKSLAILGIAALFIPVVALATTFMSDDSIEIGQTVQGNHYVAGNTINVAGTINGDFLSGGNTTNMSGIVKGDLTSAGSEIIITGTVDGDIRVAGGKIMINGPVSGEVIAFGGEIKIGPQAIILGELVASGGIVDVDKSAQITGKQTIHSGKDRVAYEQKMAQENPFAYYVWPQLFSIFVLMAAAILFSLIYKEWIQKIVNVAVEPKTFGQKIGIGSIFLFLTPIAAFLLFISAIGALFGVIVTLIYVASILTGIVFAGLIFGGILQTWFAKLTGKSSKSSAKTSSKTAAKAKAAAKSPAPIITTSHINFHWAWLLIGIPLAHLISQIPYVGWIFAYIMMTLAIGSLISLKWHFMKTLKA